MTVTRHIDHMRTAIKLAKYALYHGETPVACIFVHEPTDTVISYGMNDTNRSLAGIAHAEFVAIQRIQRDYVAVKDKDNDTCPSLFDIMSECVLYVTVEPCIMCASALKQLGVRKVYFGCANERFGGNGTVLRVNTDTSTLCMCSSSTGSSSATYLAIPGLFRREAIMLLRHFYVRENTHAPQPRNKSERSLDSETFPEISWQNYLDRDTFVQEYGPEELIHYDNGTDLSLLPLDWDLIDTPCDDDDDDIVESLEKQIRHFATMKIQSKKRKVSV